MADPATLTETVQGLLAALPNIDLYEGSPPLTVRQGVPYLIYYPNPGQAVRARLSASYADVRWDSRIVCCGWTPTQVLHTVTAVRDTLTGIRLTDDPADSVLNEVDNSATVLESAATTATETAGAGLPRFSFTIQYRFYTNRNQADA